MISEILVASGNKHKILELQTAADRLGIKLLSPMEVQERGGLLPPPEVQETGSSYRENAMLKAQAFSAWGGLPAIGDDSGLEVAALQNRPGLYSARYGGPGLTDKQRCEKLLNELREVEKSSSSKSREAAFCCYLVLLTLTGEVFEADYRLVGEVVDVPRGEYGFGYDPIIYIPSIGATMAEVPFEIKCEKSHRALAASKLFSILASANG